MGGCSLLHLPTVECTHLFISYNVGISEEEDESGGCDEDDVTSLMNGYRHGVMNGKPLIGGTALTLSQAIARCNSLTDILFGDSELLTSVCNTSCQSDDYDDHNEVISSVQFCTYIHPVHVKICHLFCM